MKILCVFGEHNYGNPARGLSYEYANFLPALRALGNEIFHFESWNRSRYRSFTELNYALLHAVETIQPDLLFGVLMHYEIWSETIYEIRKRCQVSAINWGTDDSWKYEQFTRWVAPAFDVYVTTYGETLRKATRDGLENLVLSQWAANSENLAEPLPADSCRYPVSFVGSAYGNRQRWIAGLRKAGIEVSCFGHGWEHGPVRSEEIPEIIRNSIISLNFGDSGVHLRGMRLHRSRQIKARLFEVPGAGGFLLTEDAEDIGHYYRPDEEIAVFEGMRDLQRKIRYYLGHPAERDVIARAGHERTRREHLYEQRFRELLNAASVTGRIKDEESRTNDCRFDNSWFEQVKARHRVSAELRLLKRILEWLIVPWFGPRRGKRAARRLLFELSWRLSGSRTYTASGLPGRLFYRES